MFTYVYYVSYVYLCILLNKYILKNLFWSKFYLKKPSWHWSPREGIGSKAMVNLTEILVLWFCQ